MKLTSFHLLCSATCLTLAGLALESAPAQAISVTGNSDATALVNALLGSNSGITLVSGSAHYTGAGGTGGAVGTFTGGNSGTNLGISDGVVLSTGAVTNATANGGLVNNDNPTYTDYHGTGDAALSSLEATTTTDASVLEFNFTTNTGNLFLLNYVFASQEYPDFVNTQFNDVFAFFVDGQNIATIPSTSTPVTINNVNNGTDNNGAGVVSNSAYFRSNSNNAIGIHYGGFTKVLDAQALGLGSGVHTFKIAIADAGQDSAGTPDYGLDSAVFLRNASFSSTLPTAVPEPFTIIGSLIGGTAAFRMRKKLKSANKV